MWLLRADLLVRSNKLQLEEVSSDDPPQYTILSHTWGDEEVLFKDLQGLGWLGRTRVRKKQGYRKIRFACEESMRQSIIHVWIDTCCINKDSSTELSEAINSMFRWYRDAEVCFAYLSDVICSELPLSLRTSRWFQRGWTLQELLAPKVVNFFDTNWQCIGEKCRLSNDIELATGIEPQVLNGSVNLHTLSVAARMSWISRRQTTRKEDIAYCMLGIFGVNMALLYGEGDRAFLRLQEEILKTSDDQSIFAWTAPNPTGNDWHGLFAHDPHRVTWTHDVGVVRDWGEPSAASMTSLGLSVRLPLKGVINNIFFARLNCVYSGHERTPQAPVTIALLRIPGTVNQYARVHVEERNANDILGSMLKQIPNRSSATFSEKMQPSFETKQVYVSQESFKRPQNGDFNVISSFHIHINLPPFVDMNLMSSLGCLCRSANGGVEQIEYPYIADRLFETGTVGQLACVLALQAPSTGQPKKWDLVLLGTAHQFASLSVQHTTFTLRDATGWRIPSSRYDLFESLARINNPKEFVPLGEPSSPALWTVRISESYDVSVSLGLNTEKNAQTLTIDIKKD